MSQVELRLSDIEPPEPEPRRTIYSDVVSLPDPVLLGLTVRIFNYDDVDLYMRVEASGTGWTFTAQNLGLLLSGANMWRNLDQFGSRARPSAETSESVDVTLKAYTDAGYTILAHTFIRSVSVLFIKSDDGSWTTDVSNDFDDGTVQGWSATLEAGAAASVAVGTDYVLSVPYSLKASYTGDANSEVRFRVAKDVTTPNRNNVYAITNLRFMQGYTYPKYMEIQRDGTILMHVGRAYDADLTNYLPVSRWMRFVTLLPKNTTLNLRYVLDGRTGPTGAADNAWMDDFKVISKD